MQIDWPSLVSNIIAFIAGAIITHVYYRLARQGAEKEAEKQCTFMTTALVALERQGFVKLDRDPEGQITGAELIERQASDAAMLTVAEHAAVVRIPAE